MSAGAKRRYSRPEEREAQAERMRKQWEDPEVHAARSAAILMGTRRYHDMPTASERIELERRALAGESVIDLALDYLVSVGTVRRIRYLARKRQPKDVK
jgi:hypothetical protein